MIGQGKGTNIRLGQSSQSRTGHVKKTSLSQKYDDAILLGCQQ